jgi:hypothetical protein
MPARSFTYSIAGGADAARFTIDSSSGALSFVAARGLRGAGATRTRTTVYDVQRAGPPTALAHLKATPGHRGWTVTNAQRGAVDHRRRCGES